MLRRRSLNSSTSQHLNVSSGFTLIELLVVIGIIAILLVAVIPAVNSLSKSSGRKAAISNLLGAIEQARSEAIKSGQATYVVFPTQLPGAPDAATIQRYCYHSYAVFEEDSANPGTQKQLTAWKILPTGVSFRSKSDNAPQKNGGLTPLPTASFAFQPLNASAPFPFLKFNANGEIESPPNDVLLVVNLARGRLNLPR